MRHFSAAVSPEFWEGVKAHEKGQTALENPFSYEHAKERWDSWLAGFVEAMVTARRQKEAAGG